MWRGVSPKQHYVQFEEEIQTQKNSLKLEKGCGEVKQCEIVLSFFLFWFPENYIMPL